MNFSKLQYSLSIFLSTFNRKRAFSIHSTFVANNSHEHQFIPNQKWQEAYELYRRKLFQFQIVQVLILPEDQANSN